MKCSEICALIEQEYGTEYACDWDNVGLLAGRSTKEVKKILLSLDATDEVVRMAVEGGYDMLITHHPMLFSAIKRVTDQDMNGRRLLELIRNDISYYAMHTNYDTRGMADLAARLLGLTECTVLEEVKDGEERMILGHKVTFFDILSTKAKQFGFCMEYADGKKLTCCGDEPYNECEHKYAVNSTWLLHEAFCLFSQADKFKPYEKHHSTVKDACQLAQELNVDNLILYHTEDKNISRRKELYTEEGKPYYKGNLFIPDDLETFEL